MKRIADAIVIAGLMAVVIMASGCSSVLVPIYRGDAVGVALTNQDHPDMPLKAASSGNREIVGFKKQKLPATTTEKVVGGVAGALSAVGIGLVGANNEWFRFEKSDKDDPPPTTYNVYDNEQVNFASGNSGPVTQSNSKTTENE